MHRKWTWAFVSFTKTLNLSIHQVTWKKPTKMERLHIYKAQSTFYIPVHPLSSLELQGPSSQELQGHRGTACILNHLPNWKCCNIKYGRKSYICSYDEAWFRRGKTFNSLADVPLSKIILTLLAQKLHHCQSATTHQSFEPKSSIICCNWGDPLITWPNTSFEHTWHQPIGQLEGYSCHWRVWTCTQQLWPSQPQPTLLVLPR